MTEILDISVIVLLLIAIIYGFILNKRITLIHQSKQELSKLFKGFDETIDKAQESIIILKKVTDETSAGLQNQIDKANLVLDDLSFINTKASKLADDLSALVTMTKSAKPSKAVDKELVTADGDTPVDPAKNAQRAKSIEAILHKIAEAKQASKALPSSGESATKSNITKDDIAGTLKKLGYGQ